MTTKLEGRGGGVRRLVVGQELFFASSLCQCNNNERVRSLYIFYKHYQLRKCAGNSNSLSTCCPCEYSLLYVISQRVQSIFSKGVLDTPEAPLSVIALGKFNHEMLLQNEMTIMKIFMPSLTLLLSLCVSAQV